MRIGIVLQDARRRPTGLDAYTATLWQSLLELDSDHELVPVTLPDAFCRRSYLRTVWEQVVLPAWAGKKRLDLLHVPAGSAPLLRRRPTVLTLHDLGVDPVGGYQTSIGPRLYFGTAVPRSARFASAVIADSEATKRDAVARLGIPADRISVVPLAPAPAFRQLTAETVAEVRRRYGLSEGYFLQVGALIPRKNVQGAIEGYARFVQQSGMDGVQLVFAGGGVRPVLAQELEALVAGGRVRFLGHVPLDDLVALYNGALAAVLPSFYEGFGLPLVEAFACGTPAVASCRSSLPEVGGDAALYVDPNDPASIAGAMMRFASSPELRAEYTERAQRRSGLFDRRRMAEATLAVYERAAGHRWLQRRAPRPDAPKVLFVRLDSLGDVVLTLPCFEAVKRRYPRAQVDVVVQPQHAPLLEGDPRIDRVYVGRPPWRAGWSTTNVRSVIALLRLLRAGRYDYVVVPRRDLDDALFARLCGGRETIGFHTRRTAALLTSSLPFDATRHTVENQLHLLSLLGCPDEAAHPRVYCLSEEDAQADALVEPAARLIGVAPFASSAAKSLPPERCAELVDALASAAGASVVLLGPQNARATAATVRGAGRSPFVDLTGRTSLAELCGVLRRCDVLVCVDSAPMHLAAALGVPVVALFGAEDPVLWGPYGPAPSRLLRAPDGRGGYSAAAVPVRDVVTAAIGLIGAGRAEEPRVPVGLAS